MGSREPLERRSDRPQAGLDHAARASARATRSFWPTRRPLRVHVTTCRPARVGVRRRDRRSRVAGGASGGRSARSSARSAVCIVDITKSDRSAPASPSSAAGHGPREERDDPDRHAEAPFHRDGLPSRAWRMPVRVRVDGAERSSAPIGRSSSPRTTTAAGWPCTTTSSARATGSARRPTGPASLRAVFQSSADLVILDLGLPGVDGLDVLAKIRRDSGVPVIVCSGRDSESDRIRSLDLGADDFVVKPFSFAELEARVRAVLRRGAHAPVEPPPPLRRPRHRPRHAHGACWPTRSMPMTRKEFDLLAFLAASPGPGVLPPGPARAGLGVDRRMAGLLDRHRARAPHPPQDRRRPERAALDRHRTRHRVPVLRSELTPPHSNSVVAAKSSALIARAPGHRPARRTTPAQHLVRKAY